jgi:DNA-binding NarL/FixJ family response regulator
MKLTKRQKEFISELVKGVGNKEIAKSLNVSEGTVKMTLHMLYAKFGVRNRMQLAMMYKERVDASGHN